MKILIVTPIFPPEGRGPATYTGELVRRLAPIKSGLAGQQVRTTIITFTKNPQKVEGVRVVSVPTDGGTVVRQIRLISQIWREAGDADVIYAQGAEVVGAAAVLVGKILGKPVVLKIVGDLAVELERDFGKRGVLVKLVESVEFATMKMADKIIFPAKHLQEQICGKYKIDKKKTVVIYNAVGSTSPPFRQGFTGLRGVKDMGGRKMIISCGFSELLPVKNVSGVIRAMGEMGPTSPRLRGARELWVVGDGGEREKLEKLAKDLKVKARFWGRVSNEKAREIMRKSDIFVLNSFHEGMPHALLEALAEGVPVVATKIPAVMEILEDKKTGVLVEVGDQKALVRGIREIREVGGLREKLIKNGRKLFEEKFTWESHLAQLYNQLAELHVNPLRVF